MSVYHLVEALPAAFFALLGIWAAVVRRHWFFRFVIVCLFLLACLLIPAYEVVIEFGIAIGLITLGLWFSRERQQWQFSLESALLAMVVVAVGSAVVAKAPELQPHRWVDLVGIGLITAALSLQSLWLVFGRAKLWLRILLSALVFCFSIASFYFIQSTRALLLPSNWGEGWLEEVRQATGADWATTWGVEYCLPSSLLGITVLIVALVLARGTGWFGKDKLNKISPSKDRVLAQIGFVCFLVCLISPIGYLFYRLVTPSPWPAVEMPENNGWDNFIEAGSLPGLDFSALYQQIESADKITADEAMEHLAAPLAIIDLGLLKPDFQIARYYDEAEGEQDVEASWNSYYAVFSQCGYARRFGSLDHQIAALTMLLRFGACFDRDVGVDWWFDSSAETTFREQTRENLSRLSAEQCKQLAALLLTHDRQRGSLENRLKYYRLEQENRSWVSHIQMLLQEWSDADPELWIRKGYLDRVAETRMLVVQLALQCYFLEHKQLPNLLAELVPEYLPALPVDPFTLSEIQYQNLWGGYSITSQGYEEMNPHIFGGPAAPFLWHRLQETWREFQDWVDGFPTDRR